MPILLPCLLNAVLTNVSLYPNERFHKRSPISSCYTTAPFAPDTSAKKTVSNLSENSSKKTNFIPFSYSQRQFCTSVLYFFYPHPLKLPASASSFIHRSSDHGTSQHCRESALRLHPLISPLHFFHLCSSLSLSLPRKSSANSPLITISHVSAGLQDDGSHSPSITCSQSSLYSLHTKGPPHFSRSRSNPSTKTFLKEKQL